MTVPITADPVTLAKRTQEAQAIKEAFKRISRNTDKSADRTGYFCNLEKRIGNGRIAIGEHMVLAAYAGFTRGAPKSDVQAPAYTFLALTDRWYAEGESNRDLAALIRAEAKEQGEADVATVDLLTTMSPKALADAEDELMEHRNAVDALLAEVRARRYAR